MSKKETTKNEIEVIKYETIIPIQISGFFYSRMQQVVQELVKGKTKDELQAAYKEIENKAITQDWITALETMFIFCNEFEKNAKEKNLVVKEEIKED